MIEAGPGQRIDQLDLARGGNRPLLDLEALARAFLENVNPLRQASHVELRSDKVSLVVGSGLCNGLVDRIREADGWGGGALKRSFACDSSPPRTPPVFTALLLPK